MSEPTGSPVAPKPAAGLTALGLVLTVAALAFLLMDSGFVAQNPPSEFPEPTDTGLILGWIGWSCLAVGLPTLGVGVLRLVRHADRAAGATSPGSSFPEHTTDR